MIFLNIFDVLIHKKVYFNTFNILRLLFIIIICLFYVLVDNILVIMLFVNVNYLII